MPDTRTRTRTVELGPGRSVTVTLTETGNGRTALALIGRAGHLPQIEQPAATFGELDAFVRKNVSR